MVLTRGIWAETGVAECLREGLTKGTDHLEGKSILKIAVSGKFHEMIHCIPRGVGAGENAE